MHLEYLGTLVLAFLLAENIGCKKKSENLEKLDIMCEVWTGYGNREGFPTEILMLDNSNRRYYLWIDGDENNVESYPSIGGFSVDDSILELRFPLCVEKLYMKNRKELVCTSGVGLTGRKFCLYYRGEYAVSHESLHFRFPPSGINSMMPPDGIESKEPCKTLH